MDNSVQDKIRVLEFMHSSVQSGPGRIVYAIADLLDKNMFSCDVVCPIYGDLADDLRSIGIKIINFDPEELKSLTGLYALFRRVKDGKYHVLHIHSGQYSAFWKIFGRLLGIPVIIYTEHVKGPEHDWIKSKAALFLHLMAHPILNAAVDKVIAVSSVTGEYFIRRQGMTRDKVVIIYNGVYIDKLKFNPDNRDAVRKSMAISEATPVVGIIARLYPEKGHDILARGASIVVKTFPDVKFLIVGDGPERQKIEMLLNSLALGKNFIFTGFQKDVFKFIDAMDIVVQPSLDLGEACCMAVLEAMAKSRAIVVSDINAFKGIIDDGRNGLRFIPEDPVSLSEKLISLINDDSLRERFGSAALEKVLSCFDVNNMVDKTADVYRKILGSKVGRFRT